MFKKLYLLARWAFGSFHMIRRFKQTVKGANVEPFFFQNNGTQSAIFSVFAINNFSTLRENSPNFLFDNTQHI